MVRIDDRQGHISFLQFWFFNHIGSPHKIKLPFIENITVQESQKANTVKYQPIGRAGSLFTYTGAESRRLKISFNFTFDNVSYYKPSTLQDYFGPNKDGEDQFFEADKVDIKNDSYTAISNIDNEQGTVDNDDDDETTQIIMYWVNLIRSSVLNNVEDPTLPPPLIRLTHGTMYRNIPCICHSYNISHIENAGYERASFLPRRIKVSMDLSEVRLNQYIKYGTVAPTKITDNLRGWESIIKGESLDPITEVEIQGRTYSQPASSDYIGP